MIVADVNLVAYLLLSSEKTPLARRVYRYNSDWRLPAMWTSEWANILTTYIRSGIYSLQRCIRIESQGRGLFGSNAIETRNRDVLRLATTFRIAAYDAHYIVAAVTLGVPCVTEDKALRKAVPRYTLSMAEFLQRTP